MQDPNTVLLTLINHSSTLKLATAYSCLNPGDSLAQENVKKLRNEYQELLLPCLCEIRPECTAEEVSTVYSWCVALCSGGANDPLDLLAKVVHDELHARCKAQFEDSCGIKGHAKDVIFIERGAIHGII